MISNYKTIIWDWNGTLLNDVDICVNIVNKILSKQSNKLLTKQSYQAVFGFPILDYYHKIGMDFTDESYEEITKRFIGEYTHQVKQCALHPDTLSTLAAVQQKGLSQFILTAAHKESVLPLLDHYDIHHYFKAIEGLDNYRAESKVKRGHHLIKNHQINQKSTVLIGDTIHDHDVAQALEVDCILVANGHQSWERLQKETKDNTLIINNLSELIR